MIGEKKLSLNTEDTGLSNGAKGSAPSVACETRTVPIARQFERLEAMGEITAGLAHQMNNLLAPILASFEMLRRPDLSPNRVRVLTERGLAAVNGARSLVQQLLAFGGRQPLQTAAVDVGNLVTAMSDRIKSSVGARVTVTIDVDQDLELANADSAQLEAAIFNLTNNSRHAMSEGGVLSIAVTAETRGFAHDTPDTHHRYVRISVKDTGVGMDEITTQRAVEPFFSTKGTGLGHGLGLSMARGLAMQLGGALKITSELGIGTNVELFLPVRSRPGGPLQTLQTLQTRQVAHGPSATALLVDDDRLVRSSTAEMLVDLGFYVREACSAEEAWGLIEAGESVDLIITDHLMPGHMNGVDLAHAVRRQRPQIPVLIVSGFVEVGTIAADLPRLAKPFRLSDLAACIASLPGGR